MLVNVNGTPGRVIGRGTTYRRGVAFPRLLVATADGLVTLVGNQLYAVTTA